MRRGRTKIRHPSPYHHPLEELLVIYLPFFVYTIALVIPLLAIFAPQLSLFLVSLLDQNDLCGAKFAPLYVLFTVIDLLWAFFFVTCIYYAVFFQLFFLIRMPEEIAITRSALSQKQ
jgi:hypothetical protein